MALTIHNTNLLQHVIL